MKNKEVLKLGAFIILIAIALFFLRMNFYANGLLIKISIIITLIIAGIYTYYNAKE